MIIFMKSLYAAWHDILVPDAKNIVIHAHRNKLCGVMAVVLVMFVKWRQIF